MSSRLAYLLSLTNSIRSFRAYHRLYCILRLHVDRNLIWKFLVASSSLVAANLSNMLIGIGSSENNLLPNNTEQSSVKPVRPERNRFIFRVGHGLTKRLAIQSQGLCAYSTT